jgi:hypothetical protein
MHIIMFHAHLLPEIWAEDLSTATYLLNQLPCKAINSLIVTSQVLFQILE